MVRWTKSLRFFCGTAPSSAASDRWQGRGNGLKVLLTLRCPNRIGGVALVLRFDREGAKSWVRYCRSCRGTRRGNPPKPLPKGQGLSSSFPESATRDRPTPTALRCPRHRRPEWRGKRHRRSTDRRRVGDGRCRPSRCAGYSAVQTAAPSSREMTGAQLASGTKPRTTTIPSPTSASTNTDSA